MNIVLDTSVLIDALTGPKRSAPALRRGIELGHRLLVPSLVLYEWLRGPRTPPELLAQESLFPTEQCLPFGAEEASLAADLYLRARRPRGRELDLAIAAVALSHRAELWTLNVKDFSDLESLVTRRPEP